MLLSFSCHTCFNSTVLFLLDHESRPLEEEVGGPLYGYKVYIIVTAVLPSFGIPGCRRNKIIKELSSIERESYNRWESEN